jgi:hypothetical protein
MCVFYKSSIIRKLFKFTPENWSTVLRKWSVNTWCLDILNSSPNEMDLADGFCPNYKLCETLKFSWWSFQNYCLRRRGTADRRCGRKCHLQQRQTEPLLLWEGCNSFLLNSTYLPNYAASPPRKAIFKWIYAESSSSSSRYLFCCLKNFCKLATVWPLHFVYQTTAINAVVTRSITYFPRSDFQKNVGTKTPLSCVYCKT